MAPGNIGTEMIKGIATQPDCTATQQDKVGRDAGEIIGLLSIGVIATGSVDEIK